MDGYRTSVITPEIRLYPVYERRTEGRDAGRECGDHTGYSAWSPRTKRDAVLVNAGASLYIGGKADSMKKTLPWQHS